MNTSFDEFKRLIQQEGFFGMLKQAALVSILGSRGISNQHAYEKGLTHGRMNLFPVDGDNVIWIAPCDIEVFWTEGKGPQGKHFFRTKSGKEFEVTEESWFRIMHGNEYRRQETGVLH